MILMNNTSYSVAPDKLVVDSKHPIDVKIISVAANQGTIKRGTVLSLTNTNEYLVFGTELQAPQTSAKANCVVAADTDTTSTSGTVPVEVYIAGNLNKNVMTVKDGSSLAATDIEDLRNSGIFVTSTI